MRAWTRCLVAAVVVSACGSETEREGRPATDPEPAPVSPPAPLPPAPSVLPVAPVEPSPLQASDGFSIEVDAERELPSVTVKNQGTTTFQGDVVFQLVWVGPPSGPEVSPWRFIGAVGRCDQGPPEVIPVHTWRGAMTPGWTTSWEVPRDRATFCRGPQIDGMDPPPGRYRISATFRRQDGTVDRTLWTPPFTRRGV